MPATPMPKPMDIDDAISSLRVDERRRWGRRAGVGPGGRVRERRQRILSSPESGA
jgi:hypothetical protein